MSNSLKTCIEVFIGTDDMTFADNMYVELSVNGSQFPIWSSDTTLNELGGEEFLTVLEKALNVASLLRTYLKIPIFIDQEIRVQSDDFDVRSGIQIRKLISEVLV